MYPKMCHLILSDQPLFQAHMMSNVTHCNMSLSGCIHSSSVTPMPHQMMFSHNQFPRIVGAHEEQCFHNACHELTKNNKTKDTKQIQGRIS